MAKIMAEDTFTPVYGGSKATFYAPNFVGGTGDPNQPGQATPAGPSEDTEPKPSARPKTPLGGVTFGGGGGGGRGRHSILSDDERAQIARRGAAALTAGNLAKAAQLGLGLASGTGPLTTALGAGIDALAGGDTGLGFPDFDEQRALTIDDVNPQFGTVSEPGGGGNGNQGGGSFGGAGRSGGTFGGGTSNTANGNSNSLGGGGLYRRGGTVVPRYAGGGAVGRGGGDGSGGAEFRGGFSAVRAAAPVQQPLRRGVGPTDGGMNPRTGPKPSMAGGMRMPMRGYADGGEVVPPAAVPDDGVEDNVPIMADEGEFVITRDAAVAYDPAVLEAINDPQMAPIIEQLIADYLEQAGGGAMEGGDAGMMQEADDGSAEVLAPAQSMPQQRPQSPLGRMRA